MCVLDCAQLYVCPCVSSLLVCVCACVCVHVLKDVQHALKDIQRENPLSYFSYQPVLHDWCKKGHGMYYPVCRMVHIKEPLLLIGRSSPSHYFNGTLPYV